MASSDAAWVCERAARPWSAAAFASAVMRGVARESSVESESGGAAGDETAGHARPAFAVAAQAWAAIPDDYRVAAKPRAIVSLLAAGLPLMLHPRAQPRSAQGGYAGDFGAATTPETLAAMRDLVATAQADVSPSGAWARVTADLVSDLSPALRPAHESTEGRAVAERLVASLHERIARTKTDAGQRGVRLLGVRDVPYECRLLPPSRALDEALAVTRARVDARAPDASVAAAPRARATGAHFTLSPAAAAKVAEQRALCATARDAWLGTHTHAHTRAALAAEAGEPAPQPDAGVSSTMTQLNAALAALTLYIREGGASGGYPLNATGRGRVGGAAGLGLSQSGRVPGASRLDGAASRGPGKDGLDASGAGKVYKRVREGPATVDDDAAAAAGEAAVKRPHMADGAASTGAVSTTASMASSQVTAQALAANPATASAHDSRPAHAPPAPTPPPATATAPPVAPTAATTAAPAAGAAQLNVEKLVKELEDAPLLNEAGRSIAQAFISDSGAPSMSECMTEAAKACVSVAPDGVITLTLRESTLPGKDGVAIPITVLLKLNFAKRSFEMTGRRRKVA